MIGRGQCLRFSSTFALYFFCSYDVCGDDAAGSSPNVACIPAILLDRATARRTCFGESRGLSEVTPDQKRSSADTAPIPAGPLCKIAVETAERIRGS